MGAVVGSRAARWTTVAAPGRASAAPVGPEATSLAARADVVAGSAATQARVAQNRCREARARVRSIAAAGAAAAFASVACAIFTLTPAVAPDLVAPQVCWCVAAAAALLGFVPAVLLAAIAMGRRLEDDGPPAAIGSATTLATLASGLGRALGDLDIDAHPEVARTAAMLLDLLEIEAGTAARTQAAAPARRHRRIVPVERRVVVRTADGRNLIGTIADVSLSGVALTAGLPRMAVGDAATVGTHTAIVARLWERGIAFQFERQLDPATFDESIVL